MGTIYSLHIGVRDYQALGAPPLESAHRDAKRWWRTMNRVFGTKVEAGTLLDPTGAQLRTQVRELGERLQPDDHLVVTYSGHGAAVEAPTKGTLGTRLALCPTDVTRSGKGRILDVVHLGTLVAELGARARQATFIIDACFTASPGHGRKSAGHAFDSGEDTENRRPYRNFRQARVLLACQPLEEAWEIPTGVDKDGDEILHGAFSYALTLLLQRWQIVHGVSGAFVSVQHRDLLEHAQQLLETLGAPQRPTLLGQPRAQMVPLFHPDLHVSGGLTSHQPNRRLQGAQLGSGDDGWRIYTLEFIKAHSQAPILVARILVVGASDIPIPNTDRIAQAGKEYWHTYDVSLTDSIASLKWTCEDSWRPTDNRPIVSGALSAFEFEAPPHHYLVADANMQQADGVNKPYVLTYFDSSGNEPLVFMGSNSAAIVLVFHAEGTTSPHLTTGFWGKPNHPHTVVDLTKGQSEMWYRSAQDGLEHINVDVFRVF